MTRCFLANAEATDRPTTPNPTTDILRPCFIKAIISCTGKDSNGMEKIYQKLLFLPLLIAISAYSPLMRAATNASTATRLPIAIIPQENDMHLMQTATTREQPHQVIGYDQDEAWVSDLGAWWTYASLHYYRFFDVGNIGGRVNYANRYGTSAEQYQLEAYPKITPKITAGLLYGYADSAQTLFATGSYRLEGYFTLPQAWELTPAIQLQKFSNFSNHTLGGYTMTVGKYLGNYFLGVRPGHYTPTGTQYLELTSIRYFSDSKNYITLNVGAGRLPDIGNLPPLDQIIIIKQKDISLRGKTSLNKTWVLNTTFGYTRQKLPSNITRNITDGNIGLEWYL